MAAGPNRWRLQDFLLWSAWDWVGQTQGLATEGYAVGSELLSARVLLDDAIAELLPIQFSLLSDVVGEQDASQNGRKRHCEHHHIAKCENRSQAGNHPKKNTADVKGLINRCERRPQQILPRLHTVVVPGHDGGGRQTNKRPGVRMTGNQANSVLKAARVRLTPVRFGVV